MFSVNVLVNFLLNVAIFGGPLLVPAGTVQWWRAWMVLGVGVVGTVATMASVFQVMKTCSTNASSPPSNRDSR